MIPTIVNQGGGKWAFEKLANMLSQSLWVDVKDNFGDINYILALEKEELMVEIVLFLSNQ